MFNNSDRYHEKTKGKRYLDFKVKVLFDSVKFYLPRVEGYIEAVRNMAFKYEGISLIGFDGYFEGKFEPVKYIRAEIYTSSMDEQNMINFANKVRLKLNQKSLAIKFYNRHPD